MSDVHPYPKSAQLARGARRYRRKVASPKQWQAIHAAKRGPCRMSDGSCVGRNRYHHIVTRQDGGDDVADNIVPLCAVHHGTLHLRLGGKRFLSLLTDAEYAYMIQRGGEDYPERAYGIRYGR